MTLSTVFTLAVLAIQIVILLAFILTVVLILVYVERKFIGRLQNRVGPMRTGPQGILQPVADAIKLLLKEDIRARGSDRFVYYLAPMAVFVPSFLVWATVPFASYIVVRELELGVFYIVAVSVVAIVGMVLAGWSSGSKYSVLGSARSAAQLISYELPIIFVVVGVVILAQSTNLTTIVERQVPLPYVVLQPLGFVIFMLAGLAEVGRIPFDIPQAESEVVGGPFVEYTGMRWAIFFLAEYANTLLIAVLGTLLFLGGWAGPLSGWSISIQPLWFLDIEPVTLYPLQPLWLVFKVAALTLVIFWIRGTMPRLRIDQLMSFAWTFLLPLSFLYVIINAAVLYYAGAPGDEGYWVLRGPGLAVLALLQWAALIGAGYAILNRVERHGARLRGRLAP